MFQNSFPVVGTMARSRFAYFTFHLLTFSSMVKLHATPVTASCKFDTDAYTQYGSNLIARGQGTVTIHNLTCICFVATPEFSITYPAADDSPDPQTTTSSLKCQGVASCNDMPQNCADINPNVIASSNLSISGVFNKTAVITCKSTRDSNRAVPFIVWVEPAVTLIPSSSNTTSSSMTTTTTTTTTTIIITTSSKVSSSPEMSTSIDYSTSVSPMTTAVTSQPPTETLSTQHSLTATPSPPSSPTTLPPISGTFITASTYVTSTPANSDCTVTVSTCIPGSAIIEAFAGSTSAVVFVAVMIMIILIVLFVVLKKRQRQKNYEIPPQNTELQESIMIKNNAIK